MAGIVPIIWYMNQSRSGGGGGPGPGLKWWEMLAIFSGTFLIIIFGCVALDILFDWINPGYGEDPNQTLLQVVQHHWQFFVRLMRRIA